MNINMDEQQHTSDNPVTTQDTNTGIPTPQQPTEVIQEGTTTPSTPVTPQLPTPTPPKSNTPLKVLLLILVLALLGVGGYFLFQKTQLKSLLSQPTPTPEITEAPPPSPTPDLYSEPNSSNETADWKTYNDPVHNFTIMYPPEYTVSGKLAGSLQDWKAGKGITITNTNHPAKPSIFIEAVFDGYGPFFPSGTINAQFIDNKLVIESISKTNEAEYNAMVRDGQILSGNELFLTSIIEYKDIPFWFHISHQDRGNQELEKELTQILSTFEFLE